MAEVWATFPAAARGFLLLAALMLPAMAVGVAVTRGLSPLPLVRALWGRFFWTNVIFLVLIAVSVAIGVGLLAQERGLREGSAQAAEPFPLVVTAPGSQITSLFATVYLEPTTMTLLDGAAYDSVAAADGVAFAAPLGFGDSYRGHPVVGTIDAMVQRLAGGAAIEGRSFVRGFEAVAGSGTGLAVGDTFTPAHGHGAGAADDAHAGVVVQVVGLLPPTGTPWDEAILIPIETVWETHGLPNGQSEDRIDQIGPPYDARFFPGTPAIVVHAEDLFSIYALQAELNGRDDLMAFFPGAVLTRLYATMGDVRQVLTILTGITQALLALAVLAALLILTRLFRRHLALLRALGAGPRFVFAIVWSLAAGLIVGGVVVGFGLGYGAAAIISSAVTEATGIAVTATIGWRELHLAACLVSIGSILALIPAAAVLRLPVIEALRS